MRAEKEERKVEGSGDTFFFVGGGSDFFFLPRRGRSCARSVDKILKSEKSIKAWILVVFFLVSLVLWRLEGFSFCPLPVLTVAMLLVVYVVV